MDKRSIEKVGIMELPPDQRPREKLMGRGAAFMSDSELLAILITVFLSAFGVAASRKIVASK